jgi:hypothetical protein
VRHRFQADFAEVEITRVRDYWNERPCNSGAAVRLFRQVSHAAQSVPKLRGLWNRTVVKVLYRFPGLDLPPTIRYHSGRRMM